MPTVSTTRVLSPSQWPLEYPKYVVEGPPSCPIFLGNGRPSIQTSRHVLKPSRMMIRPGIGENPICAIWLFADRGIPNGSHVFQGSFELALNGSGILSFNCACPAGVR